jgi:hypothetical protein
VAGGGGAHGKEWNSYHPCMGILHRKKMFHTRMKLRHLLLYMGIRLFLEQCSVLIVFPYALLQRFGVGG